jgi:hypothetical protein
LQHPHSHQALLPVSTPVLDSEVLESREFNIWNPHSDKCLRIIEWERGRGGERERREERRWAKRKEEKWI